MEDSDFFNQAHHLLLQQNISFELDDEELILGEFGFSSMSSSHQDTDAAIPNHNSNNPNCSQSDKRKERNSHNMLERKRRLELSQRFKALSDIIPGINKVSYF